MSERKVINKYYGPNFNPATDRLAGGRRSATVRIMTPFSMQCESCGEFIYKGKKFNARKEALKDEKYLGIEIFRFYIRCPCCAAEISYKTDPQNTDYIAEHGAKRNFEPWREEKIINEQMKRAREIEEENNPMKALENRTLDSKREIEVMEALDEIRTLNSRHEKISFEALQEQVARKAEHSLAESRAAFTLEYEEDSRAIAEAFAKKIKRIQDTEEQSISKEQNTRRPNESSKDRVKEHSTLPVKVKKVSALVDYE